MLIAKLIRYLRDKNEANISAGGNRVSGIEVKQYQRVGDLDIKYYKDIRSMGRVGDYAFFFFKKQSIF